MKLVRLVGVGVVAPWLVCAAFVPACGGKVTGGIGPGSTSSSGGPGGSSGALGGSGGSSGVTGGSSGVGLPYGCTKDSKVPGCAYPAYGFLCSGDNTPDEADSSIVCSTPTADPSTGGSLYCCIDGSSGGSSGGFGVACTVDSTLVCDPGTDGVDCAGSSDNPEASFPGYVCSVPSPQSDGTIGYCCATGFAGSSCAQDDAVTGCVYPSIGFSCAGADTPDQADPSLTCSTGQIDPSTGDILFCCQ